MLEKTKPHGNHQRDLTVWEERWGVLDRTLEAMAERYAGSTVAWEMTLCYLVERLQAFAKDQFYFFFHGFGDDMAVFSPTGKRFPLQVPEHPQYPPECALRVTLDQIAYDLDVLQRAAHQRTVGSDEMIRALETADALAWQALQPARENGLVQETTAITYFQKSVSIRVIPYASVALIGIPFTCVTVPQDYLAIPHEVAHYVFWHGAVNGNQWLSQALLDACEDVLQNTRWIERWMEEIFADVYGCLIGGPVMGLSFQDLQLERSQEDFTKDNGDHPVPFLRPYIYTQVLENEKVKTASRKLKARWQERLEERGNPAEFTPYTPEASIPGEPIACDDALCAINQVIDRVQALVPSSSRGRWSADLSAAEEVEDLYTKFESEHNDLVRHVVARESAAVEAGPGPTGELWLDWVKDRFFDPDASSLPLPPEDWERVLSATGWATEGPSGQWRR